MSNTLPWNPLAMDSIWKQYKVQNQSTPCYSRFVEYFNHHVQDLKSVKFEIYSMHAFNESLEHVDSTTRWVFYLLCIAGGVYALCSGFDGMVSVLSVFFQELYIGFILALAILSALSALGIFIARDKPSILESLGLKSHKYQSIIDEYIFSLQVYLHQKKQEILHKQILVDLEQIEDLKASSLLLKHMLLEKQDINEEIKHSWIVYLQSNFAMFVGGVLFCSDGFFVGENVASFFLSQSSTLGLGISVAVALFALASYCYVECSSLKEYLYDRLFTDQLMTHASLEEAKDDYAFFEHISPGR